MAATASERNGRQEMGDTLLRRGRPATQTPPLSLPPPPPLLLPMRWHATAALAAAVRVSHPMCLLLLLLLRLTGWKKTSGSLKRSAPR